MSPQKYASPQKIFVTPQKNVHVVNGSPLKVYATPSPKRAGPGASPGANNVFASPQQRKSPAKRVVFR